MKKKIRVGVGDAAITARGFIEAWKQAEGREKLEVNQRLYFENLEMLLQTLTTGRWVLLRKLRTNGCIPADSTMMHGNRQCRYIH